jgi:MtN3 and saliva related transmembrane protein
MRGGGVFFLEAGAGMMDSRGLIDAIGYVAATLTTVSFVPQLLRVVKLRSARDISLGMFLIFTLGTFAWLVYGVLAHSRPVWIANAVTFVLSLSILVLKLRFDREATIAVQVAAAVKG